MFILNNNLYCNNNNNIIIIDILIIWYINIFDKLEIKIIKSLNKI